MYKKFEFCFIENEYIVLIKYTYVCDYDFLNDKL